MSVKNFIPEIWSAEIMQALDKEHVFVARCNRKYEGDIKNAGDTVRITSVGDITIGKYVPNVTEVTPEELNTAASLMVVDQTDYFAFLLDDVDAAQALGGQALLSEAMRKSAVGMAGVVDAYIAGKYTEAGNVITTAGSTAVNSGNVLGLLTYTSQILSEANVSKAGRWMVASPWFVACMLRGQILKDTDNSAKIASGFVGRTMGFDVFESNNITTTGTFPAYTSQIMFGNNDAISFAEQIVKTEAYRPEKGFKDAVKGLHLYGAKVLDPKCLGYITAVHTTEINI